MSDLHVDEFYKDAARALLLLYQVFPRRRTVFVEDLCGAEDTDEFGMHSERYLACFGTLLWLGEEGYLRFQDTIRQEAIDQAVLTRRAFTLLSTGHGDSPSRLLQLRRALGDRSAGGLEAAMLELLGAMSER